VGAALPQCVYVSLPLFALDIATARDQLREDLDLVSKQVHHRCAPDRAQGIGGETRPSLSASLRELGVRRRSGRRDGFGESPLRPRPSLRRPWRSGRIRSRSTGACPNSVRNWPSGVRVQNPLDNFGLRPGYEESLRRPRPVASIAAPSRAIAQAGKPVNGSS
jgi:hypothetical protein